MDSEPFQLSAGHIDALVFSLIMGLNAASVMFLLGRSWRYRYYGNLIVMVGLMGFCGLQAYTEMYISMFASGIGALIAALGSMKAEFDGREKQ